MVRLLCFTLCCVFTSMPAKSELSFDGSLGIEYGYDDNVVVEEIDLQTDLGDQFIRYRLRGGIDYSASKNQELTAGLSINDRRFQDAGNFDLRTILVSTGYRYDFGDLTLGVDLRRADAELGGNDFLTLDQISPFFSYFISREHFIRGSYTYIDKSLENNVARDADSDELAIDYYYFINGLNRYLVLSGKWRDEDAVDDLFDFSSFQYLVAINERIELFEKLLRLRASYRYRERDFDALVNPQIGAERLDKQHAIEASASLEIIKALELYTDLRYVDNESNLLNFNFTETVYTLGVSYEF